MERQHCSVSDQLESLRAARADLSDQIDKSRKTVAYTQELLKKLDAMLERAGLKP